MKTNISIKVIEDNDLCISCGACTHICPFDNILMNYVTSRGKYDAVVQEEDICLKCNGEKNCLAVCPSYHVNYETLASSSDNDFLGKIENVYNGYAKDEEVRIKASSGGFIRNMSDLLLKKSAIDGVISITQDIGLDYTPKIITDTSLMPNSIYHNINYEKAIDLLKENDGVYLLIGLPCQITSIEQMLNKKKYAYLKKRIYAKVALICGYTFERTNMEFVSEVNKFKLEDITYRENGRYRKTRIADGQKSILFDVYNPKTVNEKINNSIMFDKFLPQKHCLFCVDHIGYCADIVVGDAWQSRYNDDKIGTNIIIARTKIGDAIIKDLDNIKLEQGFMSEIKESQHLYAEPFLGLSVAKENYFKDDFVTTHIVSNEKTDFKSIKFTLKEQTKMIYLKKLLRKRKFFMLKFFWILLEWKFVLKSIVKKYLKGYKI